MSHRLPPDFNPANYWPNPAAVEGGGGLQMHCPKCGSRNRVQYRGTGRFDSHDGRPIVESRTICPNRRHWWDGHHRSLWMFMMWREPRPPAAPLPVRDKPVIGAGVGSPGWRLPHAPAPPPEETP